MTCAIAAAGVPLLAFAQDEVSPLQEEVAPLQEEAAAPAPAMAAADQGPLEEIVVTGSRITRSGYDTPTPVTVVSEEDIQASASTNIADFVNQMPSVAGSVTPATANRSLSSGSAGVNSINLRGLGSTRTLILLDGHRSVGSLANGTVDVNTIPQGLVKNVEIVTGGASATYGSDAVAGVVNFILDRKYSGVKLNIEAGETTYGDDKTWNASTSFGQAFADGRGHVLFNAQTSRRDGIYGAPREWARNGMHMTQNPAYDAGNGEPQYLPAYQSGLNNLTAGGIISAGPNSLRGIYFGQGGSVNRYDYGDNRAVAANAWTIGGDWEQSRHNQYTSLQPEEQMDGVFGRASFALTDTLEVFGEASWNNSRAKQWGGQQTDKGNLTIQADNAFIPAEVASILATEGLTKFTMGSWNADIPTRESDNERSVVRYVLGVEGSFNMLSTAWKWDGYYQAGTTEATETVYAANRTRLAWAQDAVLDGGQIVCRAARDNVAGAAGCVPFNRMGINVNAPGAYDYFMGSPTRDQTFKQEVVAANISTNFDNPWLAPIGFAAGIEHRKESISGKVDPQYASDWIVGNFLATHGSYDVTEGYVETLVTLPMGVEFNGAVRATSYSESGSVTTWKTGLTWSPIDDLRLRATKSRDIRAPNLAELFAAGTKNTNSLTDPWNGNAPVRFTQTVTGNTNLEPEEADTLGLGFVWRPSQVPGLGLSVDYYDITLNGAIDTLETQDIPDRCQTGNTELCQRIVAVVGGVEVPYGAGWDYTTGPGAAVTEYLIANSPYNFVEHRTRGVDVELSYQFNLGAGDVTLRALGTRYLEMSESNGVDAPHDRAGQNTLGGPPKWLYRLTAAYTLDRLSMQVIGRGISSGVYDNSYVECTSGCPLSTALNRTISDNTINGAFYIDTYLAYTLPTNRVNSQIYFKINNLFDEDPVPVALGPGDSTNVEVGINRGLYDYLGRTFKVGMRFDWGK